MSSSTSDQSAHDDLFIKSQSSSDAPFSQPLLIPSHSEIQNNPENDYDESNITHNKLGTINGCYVPCLLNIMGIVLFERLGWGIGEIGILYVLLIYLISETAAVLTVLSLSAIITNGAMKGGGSYYMISRTLGPEFGGSVGILFYCAYCVNIAFCCSGCAEEIVKTFFNDTSINNWLLNLILSTSVLLFCLSISLLGAKYFSKVNIFLFFMTFSAILVSILSAFSRNQFILPDYTHENYEHQTWNWSQMKSNWINNCADCSSVHLVFGVLFSGVTGIMEGANLSGDLSTPSKSIPVGTLSAIGTAIIAYLLMITAFSGSFSEEVLREVFTIPQNVSWGNVGYYLAICGVLISSSSSALGSLFGASRVLQAVCRDNIFPSMFNIFGYGSKNGDEPLVAVLLTYFVSQCLLFIGGINLIAPIATSFFCLSYGTVNLSCFLLSISGQTNFRPQFKYYSKWTSLIGLIINIFIMFYVDFIFASISLFCEIIIFIYLIYRNSDNKINKKWGDVGQSVIFHQIRKYLLKLNVTDIHSNSKLWRPHILLFVDNHDLSLIDFCNNLKKGGLYVIGSVLNNDHINMMDKIYNEWSLFIDRNEIKAFSQIGIATNSNKILIGYQNLLSLAGLGAMKPNTVILPLCQLKTLTPKSSINVLDSDKNRRFSAYDNVTDEIVLHSPNKLNYNDYITLLHDILSMKKNIIITHNFEYFNYNLLVSKQIQKHYTKKTIITPTISPIISGINPIKKRKKITLPDTTDNKWIDVWLFVDQYSFDIDKLCDNNNNDVFPMLMMQFAHILSINKIWKTSANIRALLLINKRHCDENNNWINKEKENKFYKIIEKLRLNDYIKKIETISFAQKDSFSFGIDKWRDQSNSIVSDYLLMSNDDNSFVDDNKNDDDIDDKFIFNETPIKQQKIENYFKELNEVIRFNSDETYFTFIELPDIPPCGNSKKKNKLTGTYIHSLHMLMRHLPPTALVKCGQLIPVISTDI